MEARADIILSRVREGVDTSLVVLLPATMKLLVERNRCLPRGLGWLPSGVVSEQERVPVPVPAAD
jgi:hypothetical protein